MSDLKTEEEEKPLSSQEDDPDNNKNSSSVKNNLLMINNQKNDSGIMEVYKDNFVQEMKNLISLLDEYNYIGMDTEFPGIVYSVSSITDDFYFKTMQLNVDSLKLIQLGLTLSNSKGEYPKPYHTWQFNFEFDYIKDKSSQSSMNLLISSGLNFNKMKTNGINHKIFSEHFKNSGLVLNPRINWISFHGSYDFAYLLSNLLGNSLPKKEDEFTNLLGCYFPNHYDIRILVKEKNNLQGGLNKLAGYLDVVREGKIHQAGSDSLVTIDVFWKLIKTGFISKEELAENKNILYGISNGKDNEETINYTKINNGYYFNNINNNVIRKYNENNLIYSPFRINIYNMSMNNYYYRQLMRNGSNNGFRNIQMVNKNSLLQYC
jgi:CCR4-NOT transcription complex subunit 7/8